MMYTKRMKIRSVGELKKFLETVPDHAEVYACGGSTEDHAVWAFAGEDCISLDEDSLNDEMIFGCEDDDEYYSLCERDIYFDEETQKFRLIENETDNAFDECDSLNIQLSQPILVVAYLELWDGRYTGYKEIESGNICDCFNSDYGYAKWYIDDNGDFRCDDPHHDGTNHYLYRVYKDNVSESQKDRLKEKIYNGTATRSDIFQITRRLGDTIERECGWIL